MFKKARIKLTLFYVGVLMVIVLIFSSILIFTLERNIRDSLKDHIEQGEVFDQALLNTNDRLETLIYTLDGALLVVVGVLSYFLARKTLLPIKDALEAQKQFSADASHDLRTPLAIITTESEVLLQDENATITDYKEVLKSTIQEARKMSLLIGDLLVYARSEDSTIVHPMTILSINKIFESFLPNVQTQAKQKGINLEVVLSPVVHIRGTAQNLERAFQNIIQNALHYTPSGGKVAISMIEDTDTVTIIVADTGVGISVVDLPRVFDRFYKASHSRNDASGSGLGLPIAKQIIEQHNGTVRIESIVGEGTRVICCFPREL